MKEVISLGNISFSYPNSNSPIFDNLSLNFNYGKITAVLGHNGAGKTTLFKLIGNLLSNYDGVIKRNYNSLAMVLSNSQLYDDLSCYDNMCLFAKMYKIKFHKSSIYKILDTVSLNPETKVLELSNGMKQRLNVAKTMLINSDLIILDEPTSGLDPVNKKQIIEILKKLKNYNNSILISSHDMEEVLELADNIIYIKNGKVLLDCELKELSDVLSKEIIVYKEYPQNIDYNHIVEIKNKIEKSYYVLFKDGINYDGEYVKRSVNLKDIYILLENEAYDLFIAKI